VHPLRDAFGAVFFFHFGLTIDPGAVLGVVPQILLAATMTMVLALASGLFAARLYRFGREEALNVGFTVVARGEFSLVLAAMALAAGMDTRIGPFTAGYILLLAVDSPLLAPHSGRLAFLVPARWLPQPRTEPAEPARAPAAVGS
jgi:CPA2 family monovalent cation:H+ antiporter-2